LPIIICFHPIIVRTYIQMIIKHICNI
jgi:hypothetical protein